MRDALNVIACEVGVPALIEPGLGDDRRRLPGPDQLAAVDAGDWRLVLIRHAAKVTPQGDFFREAENEYRASSWRVFPEASRSPGGGPAARDTGRAMSQENVEVCGRCMRTFARRDGESPFSVYDPDIEWDAVVRPRGATTWSPASTSRSSGARSGPDAHLPRARRRPRSRRAVGVERLDKHRVASVSLYRGANSPHSVLAVARVNRHQIVLSLFAPGGAAAPLDYGDPRGRERSPRLTGQRWSLQMHSLRRGGVVPR